MDSALSSGEPSTNGPMPWIAPQTASSSNASSEVLVPIGPNRTAAHNRNGTGA